MRQRKGKLKKQRTENHTTWEVEKCKTKKESEIFELKDQILHNFFAEINNDPQNYEQAMSSKERNDWKKAMDDEYDSMDKKEVWILVDRTISKNNEKRPNIIDSK